MFAGVALMSASFASCDLSVRWLVWVLVVALIIGMVFLLTGGGMALSALRIAKFHSLGLDDEAEGTSEETKAKRILWYLELNQLTTMLKSNKVDASYTCIRNGVITLALAGLIVAFSMLQQ